MKHRCIYWTLSVVMLSLVTGWRLFDDSCVGNCAEASVQTAAAYVLFYRRRDFQLAITPAPAGSVEKVPDNTLSNIDGRHDDYQGQGDQYSATQDEGSPLLINASSQYSNDTEFARQSSPSLLDIKLAEPDPSCTFTDMDAVD